MLPWQDGAFRLRAQGYRGIACWSAKVWVSRDSSRLDVPPDGDSGVPKRLALPAREASEGDVLHGPSCPDVSTLALQFFASCHDVPGAVPGHVRGLGVCAADKTGRIRTKWKRNRTLLKGTGGARDARHIGWRSSRAPVRISPEEMRAFPPVVIARTTRPLYGRWQARTSLRSPGLPSLVGRYYSDRISCSSSREPA